MSDRDSATTADAGLRQSGVPWRKSLVILVGVALLATGVLVAVRADGFRALDATVPRATRWFVDRQSQRLVLADGFSGRTVARLETDSAATDLQIAQSASGVAVLDRSGGTARTIDAAELRLGPPQSVGLVAAPSAVFGVGQPGVVAVDTVSSQAVLLQPGGEQVLFDVGEAGGGDDTRIAPDGAVWTLSGGALSRVTTTGRQVVADDLSDDARFTLVGGSPLTFDAGRGRVRFGDGDWVALPEVVPVSEVVLQEPGPTNTCGWLGGDDSLWCVGPNGIEERAQIAGLDIDGADLLAIAGDAAAVVRRAPSRIVRIDWRQATIVGDSAAADADVPDGVQLAVAASVDLLWIDEVDGDNVWAVHPWGINVIDKGDPTSPLLGEGGEVLEPGSGGGTSASTGTDDSAIQNPDPDDDGVDDPPVANDDAVTARAGAAVPIDVTANDYDPDGEAIAVLATTAADHGVVDIVSATTVSYLPDRNFLGRDQFSYTIVDGDGTEATANVSIELLALDAANQAPIGGADVGETKVGVSVTVDVLLNDVDPERDALRIDSFTPPDTGGTITETEGPSGLPALDYQPEPGQSGRVRFTYRPVDSLGATGEPVEVVIEIAGADAENRPPVLAPDAVRTRRDIAVRVPVLVNDRDPDGDRLRLAVVRPLPPALEASVVGDEIEVIVRAGAQQLTPFSYTVDDDNGHVVQGSVLVVLLGDAEPNRPPIANADSATVVAGTSTTIDVLANDLDPENDTMTVLSVDQRASDGAPGTASRRGDRVTYVAAELDSEEEVVLDRFTYTITDGNGHEAVGQVTVRVLPEAVAAPPFARDDSATTQVDVPVTIDVLRNDGDPSGETPTIVGDPGCAGGGSARATSDGRVTFTPPAGVTGEFSCSYEIANSQQLRASAAIIVNVIPAPVTNQPPDVPDILISLQVGETITRDLLAGASDPDGDSASLRVVSVGEPSLGQLTRNGSTITFDAGPTPGATTIVFQVADADGGVTSARLTFRIEAADLPPIATDEGISIYGPGGSFSFAVLENDDDPDGDKSELRIGEFDLTTGDGSVTVTDRTLTITADSDFVGTLVATYEVIDPDSLTDTGEVTLTVLPPENRAPVADDDAGQVASGGTLTVPIGFNDVDPDGDALRYTLLGGVDPALGTVRLEGASLVFVAAPGASGTATIRYEASDGALTDAAVVTITVLTCAQSAPLAPDAFFQTGYQQPIFVDLTTLAANGDVVAVDPPLSAPSGVYTPPAGENGNVTFTYTVRNACRLQATGTVTIDVNQDPVGTSYTASIGRNQTISIPVSALSSDAEPLTIGAVESAPSWVAVVDSGRSILVDPRGASGSVVVTAVIVDPGGLQARVPITIDLVNLAPVARDDRARIDVDSVTIVPLQNDGDPDGDAIALQSVPATVVFSNGVEVPIERAAGDRLTINAGSARGTAMFQYTVVDTFGLVSEPANITVTINSPPSSPDVVIQLEAGTSTTVAVNAVDPDGEALVFTLDDDPSPLTIEEDNLMLTVTAPLSAASTTYDLDYTVTDASGASSQGSLLITVSEPAPGEGV